MSGSTHHAAIESGASRTETLERAILALVTQGGMARGDRLPTERALAERFNVPRSLVRTVLGRLEAQGQVVRIIGSGTYVAETPGQGREDASRSGSAETLSGLDAAPQEVLEARLLCEPGFAQLIVRHANEGDLEGIGHAVVSARNASSFEEFEKWDARAHEELARATHNRLIIDIYHRITRARLTAKWGEIKRRSMTVERREIYNREHEEIIVALRQRDVAAAETAIRQHLLTVRQTMLGF